jgi:hypothetical protein
MKSRKKAAVGTLILFLKCCLCSLDVLSCIRSSSDVYSEESISYNIHMLHTYTTTVHTNIKKILAVIRYLRITYFIERSVSFAFKGHPKISKFSTWKQSRSFLIQTHIRILYRFKKFFRLCSDGLQFIQDYLLLATKSSMYNIYKRHIII